MKKSPKENNIYIICDNIRSLYNVGSIFRTSDGSGIVTKIYLTGMTGYPKQDDFHHHQTARIAKTSLGAEKNVDWEYIKNPINIIKKLKRQGTTVYSLENNTGKKNTNLFSTIQYKFPLALIIGHEINGISKEILKLSDKLIYIPMNGIKESLNVASAYAIAIYKIEEYYEKKKNKED